MLCFQSIFFFISLVKKIWKEEIGISNHIGVCVYERMHLWNMDSKEMLCSHETPSFVLFKSTLLCNYNHKQCSIIYVLQHKKVMCSFFFWFVLYTDFHIIFCFLFFFTNFNAHNLRFDYFNHTRYEFVWDTQTGSPQWMILLRSAIDLSSLTWPEFTCSCSIDSISSIIYVPIRIRIYIYGIYRCILVWSC